ncbi:MAG TPA: hypothetical protein VND80_10400 [Steroidobacteraceae bacterium]|nr:hypothetical protein [Steroidobacteraceae bacterium]
MRHESSPSSSLSRLLRAVVLIAVSWAPAAWSQAVVTSHLQVRQVASEHGHERLRPAAAAKPGDLLQYRAVYRNSGGAPAAHLVARVPVPAGTTLLERSLEPAGAEASTDGTHFAPLPLMRSVARTDGTTRRERVPAADIRAVRWNLRSLPAGGSASAQLRVRIDLPHTRKSPRQPPINAKKPPGRG